MRAAPLSPALSNPANTAYRAIANQKHSGGINQIKDDDIRACFTLAVLLDDITRLRSYRRRNDDSIQLAIYPVALVRKTFVVAISIIVWDATLLRRGSPASTAPTKARHCVIIWCILMF